MLEFFHLVLSGELSQQQEPQDGFRKRLLTTGGFWGVLDDLMEVVASVVDAIGRVELGCLVDHA
jgi:hypothetical protein